VLRGVVWLIALTCAVGVGVATAFPWANPGFAYLVDDGLSHVLKQYVFDIIVRRDPFSYPRWWPDLALGYGTPLFNFYSPGLYYLTEPMVRLGYGVYQSVREMGVVAVVLGAAGSFTLGWRVARHPLAGAVTAVA